MDEKEMKIKIIDQKNKESWEVIDTDTEVHCVPINDIYDHSLLINACNCEAKIDWEDEEGNQLIRPVVIHNAYDGRKYLETTP